MANVCAIILAAGRSARMGTQKLLLPFAGQTVIAHIAGRVLASGVAHVLAVIRQNDSSVRAALLQKPLRLVPNPDPAGDMLSSLRVGLRALPPNMNAVLLVLGDQPSLNPSLITSMVRHFEAGSRIIVPVHNNQRGHPLLFSVEHVPELLACHDQTGPRGLLLAHPEDVHELATDDRAVLADIDHPEDYLRALTQSQNPD